MRLTRGQLLAGLLTAVGVALTVVGGLQARLDMLAIGLAVMGAMSASLAFAASRRASAGLELLAELRTQVRDLSADRKSDPFRQQVRNQLDGVRLGVEAQARALERQVGAIEVMLETHSQAQRQHLDAVMAEAGACAREREELVRRRVARLANAYERDKSEVIDWLGDDRNLRDIVRRSMSWLKTEAVREIDALAQLRASLGVEEATPLLDGWAMDPVGVYELIQLVMRRKPRCVVELGSGASTVWLGHAVLRMGKGHVWSFDHLEEFGGRTAQLVASHGLQDQVDVCIAPLVPFQHDGRSYPWYDISGDVGAGGIDLLLVDGPPGAVGEGARFPALPALASRLAPDATIVVDDANRPDEKAMISRWQELFPALQECAPLGPRTRVFVWRP